MAELTNGQVPAEALAAAAAAGAASAAGVTVEVTETRRITDASAAAAGHVVAVAQGAAGRTAVAVPVEVEGAETIASGAAGAALGALGGGEAGSVQVVADIATAGLGPDASIVEVKALVDGTEAVLVFGVESAGSVPQQPNVASAAFPEVGMGRSGSGGMRDVSVLSDVSMTVTVELGRTSLQVRDLLGLSSGSVVELDQRAGAPVDILVNGTAVARGDVVVVDDELGVRITEVLGGV